jgi:cob(I)alamin adenosyltransferase
VSGKPSPEDIAAAQKGLKRVKAIMASEEYKVVILEEANVATKSGLIGVQELLSLIVNKPYAVELVITGRYASPPIIDAADLVTDMKLVKHYFEKGVVARVGIEK